MDIYELKGLLESTSDAISDNVLVKVNLADYAPFQALDVDQVHVFSLAGHSYLIVTLSNGYLLCFNLYLNALKATSASSEVQIVRLTQVFKCGNIVELITKPHPDAILITSDSQSFILSTEKSPKSGHFNDLIVVPLKHLRAQQMLILDVHRPEKFALIVSLSDDKKHILAVG